MFYNIVSNLSLSPASTSHLTFYWRRLKREEITRKFSMVMAGALVFLQIATIVAPPDPATASSSNDIIRGGINTPNPKQTLLNEYDKKAEIRAIYTHFGITRNDIKNSKKGSLNSNNHSLKSLGRNPHSAQDKKIRIGGKTFYLRPLYTWGDGIKYPALEGKRKVDGKYFAVLLDCANPVVVDATPPKSGELITPKDKTKSKETITQTNKPKPKPTPTPTPTPTSTPTPTPVVTPTPTATPTPTPEAPPVTPVVDEETPNITLSKSASIISAIDGSVKDANGAQAQPGDIIEYTLTTANTGKASAKDYVVTENMNDILEYAKVIDPRGGILFDGTLTWPKTTIAAGKSYIATFQVQVDNPLPTNPKSVSDPGSYDLRMDNVYGNMVSVHLSIPPQKQIEVASEALPETGPGTTTLIVLTFTALIAFFYFRNRQLATEIAMLRGDHHGGGQ